MYIVLNQQYFSKGHILLKWSSTFSTERPEKYQNVKYHRKPQKKRQTNAYMISVNVKKIYTKVKIKTTYFCNTYFILS